MAARKKPDPLRDLFEAIKRSDIEFVKAAMQEHPEFLNMPAPKRPLDTRYMSPLQVALCTGFHKEIVEFLLDCGADVNYCAKETDSGLYPVLFDFVDAAIWNSRRREWDGKMTEPLNMVWKHNAEEADYAFALLKRVIEAGADVNAVDSYGRNSLMEAVGEANKLCPIRNDEGGFYPGRKVTDEMKSDFRRIFQLLIDSGADRNNVSSFSKMSIKQHHENESVWQICADMFSDAD